MTVRTGKIACVRAVLPVGCVVASGVLVVFIVSSSEWVGLRSSMALRLL